MPFKFKLSRRLARIRPLGLCVPAALLVGCVAGDQAINSPPKSSSITAEIAAPTYAELLREDFESTGFGARAIDFRIPSSAA